jgi:hypothetical protein
MPGSTWDSKSKLWLVDTKVKEMLVDKIAQSIVCHGAKIFDIPKFVYDF